MTDSERPWYLDDGEAPEGERLQKVLAQRGWGSRRACELLISEGRVAVNGEIAVLGRRVNPDSDRVEIDGVAIGVRPDLVHYLLNKPRGVVSTVHDPHGRQTVVSLLPPEPAVHPVGRLDADTEGLLILTNDGELTFAVTHPSRGVEKEYLVHVSGRVSSGNIRRLREGVELEDGRTAPAVVSQPQPGVLRITIHEGRNRQVRRMCAAIGHEVVRLVRLRIGPIRDSSLSPGQWRHLTSDEVIALSSASGVDRYAPKA